VSFDLLNELSRLLAALDQAQVEYALCGGIALAIHGVPRATQDIDLLARQADLDQIRTTIAAEGFVFESLPMTFASSGLTIQRFTKLIDGQALMLDILFAEGPLAAIWASRTRMPWREGEVSVVSRAGLISLKMAAGRPQDLADLQRLQEVERG
jgi:hypothetical protein